MFWHWWWRGPSSTRNKRSVDFRQSCTSGQRIKLEERCILMPENIDHAYKVMLMWLTCPLFMADRTRSAVGREVGITCRRPSKRMRKAWGMRLESKVDLIADVFLKLDMVHRKRLSLQTQDCIVPGIWANLFFQAICNFSTVPLRVGFDVVWSVVIRQMKEKEFM